jgi:hypothetical protein
MRVSCLQAIDEALFAISGSHPENQKKNQKT